MTTIYKFRIDTHDTELLNKMCHKYFDTWLYALENDDGNNEHVHGYCETTTKQATIRSFIRKNFGTGNSSYTLKELDSQFPVEYMAYIVKEGRIHSSGIPLDLIKEWIEYDRNVKKEIKERRKNRRTILECIEEEYFQEPPRDQYGSEVVWTRQKIVANVIAYYKDKGILVREFMMLSLCQTLCLKYVPSYDYDFRRKLMEKL